MTRWLLAGAAAWCGSVAVGQAPADPPANVTVMKTAGQPDRRVQVVKAEEMPDGKVMKVVKDLATGETFTLFDPGTGTPPPAAPAKPVHTPVVNRLTNTPDPREKAAAPVQPVARTTAAKPPLPAATYKPAPVTYTATAPAPKPIVPPPAAAVAPPKVAFAPPKPVAPVQPAVVPTSAVAPVEVVEMMPESRVVRDLGQYVEDLRTHRRGSFRMEAATGLTEARFAGRPEAVQALVQAAKLDPAAPVRGHCIGCLSLMGYADAEYVRYLRVWADDPEPVVRKAAAEAVAKTKP